MSSESRYTFGPLERRTLLMGLRGEQVAVFGVTLLLVLAAMWNVPPPLNVLVAFALATTAPAVCFAPVGGRTLDQWAPVVLRWSWRWATGRHRFHSRLPTRGHTSDGAAAVDLPDNLAGLSILSAPVPSGGVVGVVHDRHADTYTGLLAVQGQGVRAARVLREAAAPRRLGRRSARSGR